MIERAVNPDIKWVKRIKTIIRKAALPKEQQFHYLYGKISENVKNQLTYIYIYVIIKDYFNGYKSH